MQTSFGVSLLWCAIAEISIGMTTRSVAGSAENQAMIFKFATTR
jgi:hypothetical protein